MGSAAAKSVHRYCVSPSFMVKSHKRGGLAAQATRAADGVIYLPCIGFPDVFFFVSLFICPSVLAEGWWISHIPNEKILLVSSLIRTL